MAERVDRDWLKQKLAVIGVDGAVFFGSTARLWQLLSGPVTLLLMTLYFSTEMQGYFATFGSILQMQVFFELSLHVVLINVASHEWTGLRLNEHGEIEGDPAAHSRLMNLGRTALRWYSIAAVLFILLVGIGGVFFLGQESLPKNDWLGPWISLVVFTGLLLCCQPLTSLLEGCDQLAIVNRFRLRQSLTGSVVVWVMVFSGCGLWAAAGSAVVRLAWEVRLIVGRYRGFFSQLFKASADSAIHWKQEVWPLQWRLALQGIATWWAMQLLVPVMFQYHGDAAACRMGTTWNILSSLQAAAFTWVETRRPRFGQLISQQDYGQLDDLFFRSSIQSVIMILIGASCFWGSLYGVHHIDLPFVTRCVEMLHLPVNPESIVWFTDRVSERMLQPLPAAVLCLGVVLFQIPNCLCVYVRAHKRDPFLVPSLILCGSVGGLVTWFGRTHGPIGAAVAWTSPILVFQLPVWAMIWYRVRREWHRPLPVDDQ